MKRRKRKRVKGKVTEVMLYMLFCVLISYFRQGQALLYNLWWVSFFKYHNLPDSMNTLMILWLNSLGHLRPKHMKVLNRIRMYSF